MRIMFVLAVVTCLLAAPRFVDASGCYGLPSVDTAYVGVVVESTRYGNGVTDNIVVPMLPASGVIPFFPVTIRTGHPHVEVDPQDDPLGLAAVTSFGESTVSLSRWSIYTFAHVWEEDRKHTMVTAGCDYVDGPLSVLLLPFMIVGKSPVVAIILAFQNILLAYAMVLLAWRLIKRWRSRRTAALPS